MAFNIHGSKLILTYVSYHIEMNVAHLIRPIEIHFEGLEQKWNRSDDDGREKQNRAIPERILNRL